MAGVEEVVVPKRGDRAGHLEKERCGGDLSVKSGGHGNRDNNYGSRGR